MQDIGTYRIEYTSPTVRVILVNGLVRICAESGSFGTEGTDIPGMIDNDW